MENNKTPQQPSSFLVPAPTVEDLHGIVDAVHAQLIAIQRRLETTEDPARACTECAQQIDMVAHFLTTRMTDELPATVAPTPTENAGGEE